MAGRTEQQALRAFYEPIQQAVSYATAEVLTYVSTGPGTYVLSFGGPSLAGAARLLGSAGLSLKLNQRIGVAEAEGERGPFKVTTRSYEYAILDTSTTQELLVFHWHPHARAPRGEAARVLAGDPHMHVGSATTGDQRVHNRHVPTERLSIGDVLLLAIEVGAEPRDGWENVIIDARERFRRYRTWPQPKR